MYCHRLRSSIEPVSVTSAIQCSVGKTSLAVQRRLVGHVCSRHWLCRWRAVRQLPAACSPYGLSLGYQVAMEIRRLVATLIHIDSASLLLFFVVVAFFPLFNVIFIRLFFHSSFANGHTTLKTPVLVRSPKLSNVGPG